MPILATGSNSARRPRAGEAGFSLVELLAALAILSLMMGAVVMSWPSGPGAFEREVQGLHAKAQGFLDAGAQQSEIRALGVDQAGLALFRHDGFEWRAVDNLAWPEAARITLKIDDKREKLPEDAAPDYLFEPFGLSSDIHVELSGDKRRYALITDVSGKLILKVDP